MKEKTLGPHFEAIKQKMLTTHGGIVGPSLEHLGQAVIKRRNALSHPAQKPLDLQQTRGQMLADLCRLVDFIRVLDCSMPP